MHKVAVLALPNFSLFELACGVELFALPRPEIDNWYQTHVVTLANGKLKGTASIMMQVQQVGSLAGYDTVVVPSWPIDEPIPPYLRKAILDCYQAKTRILAFCSGAFLLAGLGLLTGRKATTHWRYAEAFQQRFPGVSYQQDVLYTLDPDIGCSAGSAAAIDLGIAVIKQDFGHNVANKVARRMVLAAHRQGGQTQFSETPVAASNNSFSLVLDWANANLNQDIGVGDLAKRANMSRRSFDRRFRKNLGISPQQWLIRQRLTLAQNYLEQDSKPIEWIAQHAGFKSAMSLRHHFRQVFGTSPSQYRTQFQHSSN